MSGAIKPTFTPQGSSIIVILASIALCFSIISGKGIAELAVPLILLLKDYFAHNFTRVKTLDRAQVIAPEFFDLLCSLDFVPELRGDVIFHRIHFFISFVFNSYLS